MFSSAERIRNRVAELEADERDARLRASAPLTALQIFETTLGACSLAYKDLRGPIRAEVEASIAKAGGALPPDQVPDSKFPGGLLWMDAFEQAFIAALDKKVPVADALYVRVAGALCVINYLYESAKAASPTMYGATVDHLERALTSLGRGELVKELVAAVRRAAPDKEVFALTKSSVQSIRTALGGR